VANPKAEVEITASSRGLASKLREARAQFKTFGTELKKNIFGKDASDKKTGGILGKAGAVALGNLGSSAAQGALGFLVDSAQGVMKFEEGLTRLQITAEKTPEEMRAFADSVRQASDATGESKADILGAASSYVALTGDMATAQSQVGNWAKVAQATNSSMSDIAATAAAMKQNLGILPDQTLDAFGILATQGKRGAIELKDLAAQMSNIAPQWAMFKDGRGVDGLRQMGAALQVVKQGFGGDASETVTGLQGLLTALVKNSGRFKAAGVKVFDVGPGGVKTMRSVYDIVEDIGKSKLVNDPALLEKAFGRVEAYRAFLQMDKNRELMHKLADEAGGAATIANDLATYQASAAGKMAMAWERMKNEAAAVFTPERVENFATALVKVTSAIGGVATGLGKVISGVEWIARKAAELKDGQSEEDRIEDLKKAHLQKRRNLIGVGYDKKHAAVTGIEADWWGGHETRRYADGTVDSGERETAIDAQLKQEELLKTRLAKMAAGEHTDREVPFEIPLMLGMTAKGKTQQDYNIAELKAGLSGPWRGTSDDPVVQKYGAAALDRAIKDQTAALQQTIREIMAFPNKIQIGANPVAVAVKEAPANRTRPSK
jgi:TP901 family phage tail tape measure protein